MTEQNVGGIHPTPTKFLIELNFLVFLFLSLNVSQFYVVSISIFFFHFFQKQICDLIEQISNLIRNSFRFLRYTTIRVHKSNVERENTCITKKINSRDQRKRTFIASRIEKNSKNENNRLSLRAAYHKRIG